MNKQEAFLSNIKLAAAFGAGVAGGLIAGVLISSRLLNARRMPHAPAWERVFAQERGHVQASCLINRVESRYWRLFCQRPGITNVALRKHLVQSILPGLALYQELLEEGLEKPDALAAVENVFIESMGISRKPVELLGKTPLYFPVLRALTPRVLESSFPEEGFSIDWVENSEESVAFDIKECFYLDTLTTYGSPELTLVYCRLDDVIYDGASASVKWKRTDTLARGNEVCNFRWTRTA